MIIESIEIVNILSIEHACINFGTDKLVLVEGHNYDDDTANGAGKTAIFNSLSFGLYGKLPRKITISEIIRRGTKEAKVIVNVQVHDSMWKVERCRPSKVRYWKNDIEQDINQEEFEKQIGMTYDQFLISMYTSQDSSGRFLDLNDSGKKDFLLKLMNLEEFNGIKKNIDLEIRELNNNISLKMMSMASVKSKIEVYQDNFIDEAEVQKHITKLDISITQITNQISQLSLITKPDLSDFEQIEEKISKQRKNIMTAEVEINSLTTEIKNLERSSRSISNNKINGNDTHCPECSSVVRVIDNELFSTNDISNMENKKKAQIQDIQEKIDNLNNTIASKDKVLNKKQAIAQLEKKIQTERSSRYEAYDKAQCEIQEYKQQLYEAQSEKKQLLKQIDGQKNKIQELKILKKQLHTVIQEISDIKKDIEILTTVSNIYAPTGAPAYIMDSVIEAFNDKVKRYVDIIWPNASYSLTSYKENKNGDIRAKFSEKLEISGTQSSIGSLSGGQYKCLSLAVDLALIDVLSERFSIHISPLILDEPFVGLDVANRDRALEMLRQIVDREIWIVDHASETRSCFSSIVTVELRGGISTILTT